MAQATALLRQLGSIVVFAGEGEDVELACTKPEFLAYAVHFLLQQHKRDSLQLHHFQAQHLLQQHNTQQQQQQLHQGQQRGELLAMDGFLPHKDLRNVWGLDSKYPLCSFVALRAQ